MTVLAYDLKREYCLCIDINSQKFICEYVEQNIARPMFRDKKHLEQALNHIRGHNINLHSKLLKISI